MRIFTSIEVILGYVRKRVQADEGTFEAILTNVAMFLVI